MIDLSSVSVHLPLRRARLNRRMISAQSASGGHIIEINSAKFVAALDNVSFKLQPGDCVALIGKNGSGKTTLLRTIAGIYEPTKGLINVKGTVATMFAACASLSDMETGRQNIEYSCVLHGIPVSVAEGRIEEVISACGLGEFINVPVSMYSEGMRARLGIAMAILSEPNVLLVDEAITTTDSHFINSVSEQTGMFRRPETISIIATHAQSIQQQYCNKAIWLDHGQLRAIGDYKTVHEQYDRMKVSQNISRA